MHSCGLCRKNIPEFSIHSIDSAGRKFHVDCASLIRNICKKRQRKLSKQKQPVSP
jgi:hypothetical protein